MNLLLVLLSAVLLPLALPNELFAYGLPAVGIVALLPVFYALYRSPSWRHSARYGAIFGAVSTALGNYWLAFFGDFSVWTIGGAVLGYTGYNYILFGYLDFVIHRGALQRRGDRGVGVPHHTATPLLIAITWVGYEYLKSVGFLGYPWGLIAYPVAAWETTAQIAETGGVWILSFVGSYINSVGAFALFRLSGWLERTRTDFLPRHAAALAVLTLWTVLFGLWRAPQFATAPEKVRFTLVQQNVDSWQPGRFEDALLTAQEITVGELLENRRRGGAPPDAVVWSETALRRPYQGRDAYWETTPAAYPFVDFLRLIDVPLVTGAPMPAGERDATNSALVIDPRGELLGAYGKQQLVPFAESIPFWSVPAVQEFFRTVIGIYGTWVPGAATTVLSLDAASTGRPVLIGMPICFEDGFGWVPREMVRGGAEILVNLTNNSWSRQYSAQTQHFVAARLRTIELRTTLVRGTNSGLSGVIDARGRLIAELPMFESTAATVDAPLYRPILTGYRLFGDALGQLAALAMLVWVIVTARKQRGTQAGAA